MLSWVTFDMSFENASQIQFLLVLHHLRYLTIEIISNIHDMHDKYREKQK